MQCREREKRRPTIFPRDGKGVKCCRGWIVVTAATASLHATLYIYLRMPIYDDPSSTGIHTSSLYILPSRHFRQSELLSRSCRPYYFNIIFVCQTNIHIYSKGYICTDSKLKVKARDVCFGGSAAGTPISLKSAIVLYIDYW